MDDITPPAGALTYTVLEPSKGRADEPITLWFVDHKLTPSNVNALGNRDLAHLRDQLVHVLCHVENAMEERGFFKRYTTKDQD
jgi:hypothetical protein